MSKAKLRAEAINRFVTDAKAQGVYDSLKAACILTGWDTLAGALTPLVGSAPTNNGFVAADLDRGGQGLKGNGSSKYIDSNRAGNADGQNDMHAAVFGNLSSGTANYYIGTGLYTHIRTGASRCRSNLADYTFTDASGFKGISRQSSASFLTRVAGASSTATVTSLTPVAGNYHVFKRADTSGQYTDSHMSWYSIGSSVDLSALDTLVTRLMADLRAIEEDGMDRDALAYCRAVEAQDGSFMVTGVKQAVDRLVKGLKYDKDSNGRSAWDAIGASCLLCGPRTIAGALVPLKGVAPTAEGGWVSGDYNQETGMKGNGSTLSLNSNRYADDQSQDDFHMSVYVTEYPTTGLYFIGDKYGTGWNAIYKSSAGTATNFANRSLTYASDAAHYPGFLATERSTSSHTTRRRGGTSTTSAISSQTPPHLKLRMFASSSGTDGAANEFSNARMSFYSIGASLSLSALDSRITKYVNDVAAAIP